MMVGWHVVEMRGRAGRWTPQGPVIGRLAQPAAGNRAICGLSDPAQSFVAGTRGRGNAGTRIQVRK